METQNRSLCAKMIERISPAQLKVLQAFAMNLRPHQVADELHLSLATVSSHNTFLLRLCREIWSIPDDTRLDYSFLHSKFAGYFQDTDQGNH